MVQVPALLIETRGEVESVDKAADLWTAPSIGVDTGAGPIGCSMHPVISSRPATITPVNPTFLHSAGMVYSVQPWLDVFKRTDKTLFLKILRVPALFCEN